MNDLKAIVARNIIELRRENNMTQLELAERLNYTDKAVSKWERGESLPDIAVLKTIADMFGVSMDYLVTSDHSDQETEHIWLESEEQISEKEKNKRRRFLTHAYITGVSVLLVWLLATFVFVIIQLINPSAVRHWLAFLYAVPLSCVLWLIFNSIWFNSRRNFWIVSLLMWSVLASIHVTFMAFGVPEIWLLYILGAPGQAIILVWSRLFKKVK
jgi:transcriptional regulator with XRE-family HTH domain